MLDVPLRSENLLLREFRAADIAPLARIASTEGFSFYAFPASTAPSGEILIAINNFVHRCIKLQQPDPNTGIRESYKLVIADVTNPRSVIGYVALDEISESRGEDRDICYLIDPAHQGKGYALQACAMLLREFFAKTSYDTVMATVHPENTPSIIVLRRLGYLQVNIGTKLVRDVVEPRLVFSLRRKDFFARPLQPTTPVVHPKRGEGREGAHPV